MPAFSSEERQLLNDSLRDLLADKYTFEHFKKLARADDGDGFGRADWATYAEMGWLGVALPESAGGAGGGATELGIVMAGAGRFLLLEPLLGTIVLGASAIEKAGTPNQQKLLGDIAEGKLTLAFCHYEPDSGYARDYVRTVARRDGDGYVIDGTKAHTIAAHAVDTLVVSARLGSDKGPVALFLVPRTSAGIKLAPAPALDGRRGAAATLTGVRVPASAKLGSGDADLLPEIGAILDRGAIAVCAEAVGAMAAVTQITVDYLKTRKQFGQLLSQFQVLQHRLVDMSVTTEEARALVHAALQALDDNDPQARQAVWKAKIKTAQCARFVGGQAIQLHGGMGMTDELIVGHYYKRLVLCETLLGDGEWYLRQLAAEVV
jgi:alkylation response protein AidB-like acyl-CoA dehydrogenase